MTNWLLGIHVAGGSAALLSMILPLLSHKGGRLHRRAGWVFVAGMSLVCITAMLLSAIRFLTDASATGRESSMLLFYIGILTGAGMWGGMRVLRAKHRVERGSAIDIAMAGLLAGSGAVTALYGALAGHPLFIAFSLIGLINGTAAVSYWLRPPTVHMHWWFAHMGNMLGACTATITAFVLAGGRRIGLPGDSLVLWLGPTAIGLPVIAVWTLYYRRRFAVTGAGRQVSRAAAVVVAAVCVVGPALTAAQVLPPGGEHDEFDVASIKPSDAGPRMPIPRMLPGGQLQIAGVTLRDLIRMAYPARAGLVLVEGAPAWVAGQRFDVIARTKSGSTPTMRMLRTLLEERFNLRAHIVSREGTVFALVKARRDGRLGDGLSEVVCGTDPKAAAGALEEALQRAAQAIPVRAPEECGRLRFAAGPTVIGEGITVGRLAALLSEFPILSAPVVDQTGIHGTWNLRLQFRGDNNPNPDDGPLMPAALEEQLGLRLERTRGDVDVLVIDSVTQLTAN